MIANRAEMSRRGAASGSKVGSGALNRLSARSGARPNSSPSVAVEMGRAVLAFACAVAVFFGVVGLGAIVGRLIALGSR